MALGFLKKNQILRNFSLLTLANVIVQLLSIISSIKLARTLDTSIYGQFNIYQIYISIFVTIASLGLRNIIIRSIARNHQDAKKILLSGIWIRIIGIVFSLIIFFIYFIFFKEFKSIVLILLIQGIISLAIFDVYESVAFGLERMEFTAFINVLFQVLWVITIFVIPIKFFTEIFLFGILMAQSSLKTLLYIIFIHFSKFLSKERISNEINLAYNIKGVIYESMPYYYLAIVTLISNQIPVLFLENRSSLEQVAYFNLANKLLSPMSLLLSSTLAALYPNLSRLFVNDYKKFIKRFRYSIIFLAIIGISVSFGVAFFRKELVVLFYGEKYNTSGIIMAYQCWYFSLYSILCLIGLAFGCINRQKELSYLGIICTLIQVPILYFYSSGGAVSLSVAFVISTVIIYIPHAILIVKYLNNYISYSFFILLLLSFSIFFFIAINIPENLNFSIKLVLFLLFSGLMSIVVIKYKNNFKKLLN